MMNKEKINKIEEISFYKLYTSKSEKIFELSPKDFNDVIIKDLMTMIHLGKNAGVDVFENNYFDDYFEDNELLCQETYFAYLEDRYKECYDEFIKDCDVWIDYMIFYRGVKSAIEFFKNETITPKNFYDFKEKFKEIVINL